MAVNILKSRLPNEYQEVEWIKSNDNAYIDVNITITSDIGFEVTANISSGIQGTLIGNYQPGHDFFFVYVYTNNTAKFFPEKNASTIDMNIPRDTKTTFSFKNGILDDGTTQTTVSSYATYEVGDPIYLFSGLSTQWYTSYTLYECKIYNGSTVVSELIPCYRKEDDVIGLYDIIRETFYSNANNVGSFTKGNDVNNYEIQRCKVNILTQGSGSNLPAEYQEVEYIQGSGTQYIDTGVNISSSDVVKCKFEITSSTISMADAIYGCHSGNTNTFFVLLMRNPTQARVGGSVNQASSNNYQLNTIYNTSLTNGTYIENGVTYTFTPYSDFTQPVTFWVLSRNQNACSPVSAKVYSFEIEGKFNGIPCYRKEDNEIGMYDTVSETFFTNAGSGAFTKGIDKTIPSTYQEVEYIELDSIAPETTGILTDVSFNDVSRIRIKYEMLNEVDSLGHPMIVCGHATNSFESTTPYACIDNTCNGIYIANPTSRTDINNPREFEINTSGATSPLIKIGGWNDIYWTAVGRYYHVKFLNGSYETTHWFIPVYRKADGEIGLYDVVGETFYPNGGTGTMTKGDNIGGIEIQRVRVNLLKSNPNYHNLPSEYQEVEYIESTGTQYINTGVDLQSNIKFEYESSINSGVSSWLWLTVVGHEGNSRYIYSYYTDNKIGFVGTGITGNLLLSVLPDEFNSFTFEVTDTYKEASINNSTPERVSGTLNTIPTGIKILLFKGGWGDPLKGKIKSMKIKINNTLVRNCIPCYRKSDNEIGLYDKVTDTFYTNAGTGDFTKGNNVNNYDIIRI